MKTRHPAVSALVLLLLAFGACDAAPPDPGPIAAVDEPATPPRWVEPPPSWPVDRCDWDPVDGGPGGIAAGWIDAPSVVPYPIDPAELQASNVLGVPSVLRPAVLGAPDPRPWTSGRPIAVHGERLFALDREGGRLAVLDRKSGVALKTVAVGTRPEELVVGPDGAAYVTVRSCGHVAKVAPGDVTPEVFPVGRDPRGIALSPEGDTLWVVLSGEGTVAVLDPATGQLLARHDGFDHPRDVAVSPLGFAAVTSRSASVALLPSGVPGPEAAPPSFAALRDLNPFAISWGIGTEPDSIVAYRPARASAQSVDPTTGLVLVAHDLVNPGNAARSLAGAQAAAESELAGDTSESARARDAKVGGQVVQAYYDTFVSPEVPGAVRPVESTVTTVGPGAPGPLAGGLATDPVTGEPLIHLIHRPSDIAHHPSLSLAFVTGFATDSVLVLNTLDPDPMRSPVGLLRVGAAPIGVAFDEAGDVAYVLDAQDFTVSKVDLLPLWQMSTGFGRKSTSPTKWVVHTERFETVAFAKDPLSGPARLGRRTFTYARNPRISHMGRLACVSCHEDGGEDGLAWFMPDGPRQTPALAGRLPGTGPFNWKGSEPLLTGNMARSVGRMSGLGLLPEELEGLQAFLLTALVPPPNPNLVASGPTEAQLRGEAIFHDPAVGCSSCHVPPAFTDGLLHDVGTASALEVEVAEIRASILGGPPEPILFDTPSLRGLHATAPYFHDGSAATLEEVLDRTSSTMGHTGHLDDAERADLISWLLTL